MHKYLILTNWAKNVFSRNIRRRKREHSLWTVGDHSHWVSSAECLETRVLLDATLSAIGAQQIAAGKMLYIPLTATSSTNSTVQFAFQSSNSNVTGTVLTGNPSLKMTVSGTDANNQPFSGVLTFQLFQNLVPTTVARIEQLVNSGFYNGLTFHRIIDSFVAQGGDPSGTGAGGSGTLINDEYNSQLTYNSRGLLGLANRGHDTNDSQFFITDTKPSATLPQSLNFQQPIIGILTSGFDTFQKLITTPTNASTQAPLKTAKMTNVQIFNDTQNGVLQITAPSSFTGSSNVSVASSDGSGQLSVQNFTTTVVPNTVADRPFLGTVTNQTTNENTPITFDVQGIDLENNPLTFVVKAQSGFDSTALNADPNSTGSDPQNVAVSMTVTPASATTPVTAHITLTPTHNFTGTISLVIGVRDQVNRGNATSINSLSNFDTQKFTLTVNAQTATKLVFTQVPGTATTGTAVSPVVKVTVEDQAGHVVTGDNSIITLTPSLGGFAGGGTATAQAVNGVATFSNLVFNTPGNITLTATDGSLTKVTSAPVTVSSPPPVNPPPVNPPPPPPVTPSATPAAGISVSADGTTLFVVGTSEHSRIVVRETATEFVIRMLGGVHDVKRIPKGSITNIQIIPGGHDRVIVRHSVTTDTKIETTPGNHDRIRNRSNSAEVVAASTQNVTETSSLVFTQEPAAAIAGQTLSPVVVTLENSSGKVVTGTPTTVTLTLSSGTFAGGSNTAAAQTVNGVATFSNLVINVAGSYTLSASGGAATGATSASFNMTAAAASKLAFFQQPPTTTTAGAVLAPAAKVFVEDQFGNVVTGDNSTITVAPSTGSFGSGSTTSVQAQNGVATFSNLILTTAGTFTLKASDGSLTGATSNIVDVSAAAASKLIFTATPATGSIGQVLTPAVLVSEVDQFNNVITGDSSTEIAIAPGTGSFGPGSTTIKTLVNGVATFNNLFFTSGGTLTLIAGNSSLPGGNAVSNSITIS